MLWDGGAVFWVSNRLHPCLTRTSFKLPLKRMWSASKATHCDVLFGIPELVLDERDILTGALLRRVERSDVGSQRCEEFADSLCRGAFRVWVSGDEP